VPRDVKRARYKDQLRRDHTNPRPSPKSRRDEGGKKKDEE
jgi:hypothetical protein